MRTKGRTIKVFYTIAKLLKEEGQMVIITNKDNVGDLVNFLGNLKIPVIAEKVDLGFKITLDRKECQEHCGMNYCEENGCQERRRELVNPIQINIDAGKDSIEQVKEFMQVFKQPISTTPNIPDKSRTDFRIGFLKEELAELEKAVEEKNIVELADALADIQYVLDGFFLESGLAFIKDEIMDEVHRSNMTKACKDMPEVWATIDALKERFPNEPVHYEHTEGGYFIVYRNSDKKVMKSAKYSPVDLKSIIDNYGQGKNAKESENIGK